MSKQINETVERFSKYIGSDDPNYIQAIEKELKKAIANIVQDTLHVKEVEKP